MSYTTVATFTSPDGERQAEIFRRASGTFEFREFRWDRELEAWSLVGCYSEMVTATGREALAEMKGRLPWLAGVPEVA